MPRPEQSRPASFPYPPSGSARDGHSCSLQSGPLQPGSHKHPMLFRASHGVVYTRSARSAMYLSGIHSPLSLHSCPRIYGSYECLKFIHIRWGIRFADKTVHCSLQNTRIRCKNILLIIKGKYFESSAHPVDRSHTPLLEHSAQGCTSFEPTAFWDTHAKFLYHKWLY